MAGTRTTHKRIGGLDIGRLTVELHSEFVTNVDILANPDMRRWNSRKGKATVAREAKRASCTA